MQIVLGKHVADRLRENYTVLELETFSVKNETVTAYCVVDQVPVLELATLENFKELHQQFIDNYNKGDFNFCRSAAEHLKGKFNGDLDSFYDILIARIDKST
jgi:hypothetical protein